MPNEADSEIRSGRAELPRVVATAIQKALGVQGSMVRALRGGENERTFLMESTDGAWVVRVEAADGLQLRRAYAAQSLAAGAGVNVPRVIAHDLDATAPGEYVWVAEERIAGEQFDPRDLEPAALESIAVHLGQQLRALHTIRVEAFGLQPPEPYGTFATHQEWIDHKRSRVSRAVESAGIATARMPLIESAYSMLFDAYSGPPRLCHGDTAGSNILVREERVAALIDWEWACGCDPAWNVAYWSYWHGDGWELDRMLAGYQPPDPRAFRKRVLAYQVVHAIDLINDVFGEQGNEAGVRLCRRKLEGYLKHPGWE